MLGPDECLPRSIPLHMASPITLIPSSFYLKAPFLASRKMDFSRLDVRFKCDCEFNLSGPMTLYVVGASGFLLLQSFEDAESEIS